MGVHVIRGPAVYGLANPSNGQQIEALTILLQRMHP